MEEITIDYEESYMRRFGAGESPCINSKKCIGCEFVDIYGNRANSIFPEFKTPLGHTYMGRCVLCIRRDVTRQFYLTLYDADTPQTSIIHPYIVKIDEPDQYDGDCCLFPPTCDSDGKTRFVGLVGPYPRFDAITLQVDGDKIKQCGVRYKVLPTLIKPFIRQGARRINFFYNTTAAIILAGYICEVSASINIDVVDIYKKCISKRNNQRLDLEEYKDKTTKKWLNELNQFMFLDYYDLKQPGIVPPHLDELTIAVQEHVVYLASKDQLLQEAILRKFPQWNNFVEYIKEAANNIRRGKSLSKLQRVYLQSNNNGFLNKVIRCREWKLQPAPSYVPDVYLRLQKLPNVEKEIENLLAFDFDEFARFVGGVINQHMYLCVLLPENMQTKELTVYVCTICQSFKSQADTPKPFFGHNLLSMDWCDNDLYCELKDLTGKRHTQEQINKRRRAGEDVRTVQSKKNSCKQPLLRIPMGTHIAHINGVCKILCHKCRRVCDYTINRMFYKPICSHCEEALSVIKCAHCGLQRSEGCNVTWLQLMAFKDGGLSACRPYWFCKRHTFQCTRQIKYWALPVLLEKVNSIFVKKSNKKSST